MHLYAFAASSKLSRCLTVCAGLLSLSLAPALPAQSAAAVASQTRLHGTVDTGQRAALPRPQVPAWANAANDLGTVPPATQLTALHLVLSRAPAVEAAFQQLLVAQQDPASPLFHRWLTPAQNAAAYGVAPADVAAVTAWLGNEGLHVDDVAAGGVFISFSGTAAQVGHAFGTELRNYRHEGATRFAASGEPTVPAALGSLVANVSGLTEYTLHPHSATRTLNESGSPVNVPAYTTTSGNHYIGPADFNTIYDVPAAVTGTGVHAAVIMSSRINASDITGFNSYYGLNVAQPNQILVSTDPGIASGNSGSEGEALLDVQRVLGTAQGSTVDLLAVPSLTDSNIQAGLQYEISTLNDPVLSMSFGSCDYNQYNNGSYTRTGVLSREQTYDSYFSTLAAQGVSILVSSGDNGAAACNPDGSVAATQMLATNVLCASSYVTCVGGTEFNDTGSPASYWATTNNTSTKLSALGYIPEGAWNEPTQTSQSGVVSYTGFGTGGGQTLFPKPSWQVGASVPTDGYRDVPDISFTAAGHDGFIVCEADSGNNCSTSSITSITFGTSASAPSMAGVAVLLNAKLGARQGNLNPLLYRLAGSSAAAFHDATPTSSGVANCTTATPSICNNSTPSMTSLSGGEPGYSLQTGYDEATGLGSLDVNAFFTAAGSTATNTAPAFTIAGTPVSVTAGATTGNTSTITVTSTNGFAGSVALSCSAVYNGTTTATYPPTCTLSPASVTLTAGGSATATATLGTTAFMSAPCTSELQRPFRGGGPLMVSLGSLLLLCVPRRRWRGAPVAVLVLLAGAGLAMLTGCSGGGTPSKACPAVGLAGTTAGTYTVTVSGSGTSTGTTTAANAFGSFTLTVN